MTLHPNEQVHPETGEVMTSGAIATQIATQGRVQMQATAMGIGNRSLNDAIEHALNELPAWFKADTQGNRGKYATLKDMLVVARPVLLKHRIRIRQGADRSWPCEESGGMKGRLVPVYTDLIHLVTGEIERTQIEIPLTRLDPQAMGSAITYGKRYTFVAALGMATDEADDDGASATPRDISEPVKKSPDMQAMISEIDACKKPEDLIKWGNEAKTKARINKLTEAEATIVREYYASKGKALIA